MNYLVNEIGLPDVTASHDLAFLSLPMQGDTKILDTYGLADGEYITCVPSGLYAHYTPSFEDYIQGWISVIHRLLDNPALHRKKIILFAHVINAAKKVDDATVIKELYSQLQSDSKVPLDRIMPITDMLLASEARAILGHGYCTISGRKHATVSTFQMGRPAIPLSYSVKYAGVIGQSLEQQDLIIEAADPELWRDGRISNEVQKKVDRITSSYSDTCKRIAERVAELQSQLTTDLDDSLRIGEKT